MSPWLFPTLGQVKYTLLARLPLSTYRSRLLVRLACVRRSASVHPEPGSNSSQTKNSYIDIVNAYFISY